MNTTHKTLATLLSTALLASGLAACSSDPVAPAQIRQDSKTVKVSPGPEGDQPRCQMHTACAR